MSTAEAQAHFERLSDAQKARFNNLVMVALKLGKPIEGAYEYAKTIMEEAVMGEASAFAHQEYERGKREAVTVSQKEIQDAYRDAAYKAQLQQKEGTE